VKQLCKSSNLSSHLKLELKMETQITASAPKLFIGIDIHKKSWAVHIRSDISDHKTMTFPPENEQLFDYVSRNFPTHQVHMTYEAGCCGFSASRYFLSMGWEVTVVNPADVPRKDKQNYQKTDRIDCRNLARQLQGNQLKGIHIPTLEQDLLKSLLRQRAETTRQLRAIKSQIKGLLLYHGLMIPGDYDNANWSKNFIQWLWDIEWPMATGKLCLESKLRMYQAIKAEYLLLANQLRTYCRKHHKRDYYLLKTVPGVGGYLASAILAEIGDLRRFSNEAQFASYVGIVPWIRNSGETERVLSITPRCRPLLRSYLIEAAWKALRLDPEMQEYYRKHSGKDSRAIIIKIAHKLLNRILSVIKHQKPYQCNYSLQTKNKTAKESIQ
jgi:transposase